MSHRGLWHTPSERNSLEAFSRSFQAGYGTELDVRDALGTLVVSHDPPVGDVLLFDRVLDAYSEAGQPGALAVNIKADGLAAAIGEAAARYEVTSFFCFDQSVPDLLSYIAVDVPTFVRQSDIEPLVPFPRGISGVWLDSLYDDAWFDESIVKDHIQAGRSVCIVSPELHGRDPHPAWTRWISWSTRTSDAVTVCTDRPCELMELLV